MFDGDMAVSMCSKRQTTITDLCTVDRHQQQNTDKGPNMSNDQYAQMLLAVLQQIKRVEREEPDHFKFRVAVRDILESAIIR